MLIRKDYQESAVTQAFCRFKPKKLNFFLLMVKYSMMLKYIYFSRGHFAAIINVDPKTIDRWCEDFDKLGLMTKAQPPGKPFNTCYYKLTELGMSMNAHALNLFKFAKYVFLPISILAVPSPLERKNVQLYKSYNEKIFISESIESSECLTARVRARESDKKVTGSKEHKVDIPQHIQKLTPILHLTAYGQFKLAGFNEDTIDYALTMIKQSSSKNVFREFVDQCVAYCKENDLTVDWKPWYNALEDGLIKKNDFPTSKKISASMLKGSCSVAPKAPAGRTQWEEEYIKRHREEKRKQRELEESQLSSAQLQRRRDNSNQFLASLGMTPPVDVITLKVEEESPLVEQLPEQWSLADQQLIKWVLEYIDSMKETQQYYKPFLDEIALGPSSPRALTGELQEGFALMRKLVDQQKSKMLEKNLVTQKTNEIVCGVIETDDQIWANVQYDPLEEDGVWEEVL